MNSKNPETDKLPAEGEIIGYALGIGCYWFCLACIGKGPSYHNRFRAVEAHVRRALIDLKKGHCGEYYKILHVPAEKLGFMGPRGDHEACWFCDKEMLGCQEMETPAGLEWRRRENEKPENVLDW